MFSYLSSPDLSEYIICELRGKKHLSPPPYSLHVKSIEHFSDQLVFLAQRRMIVLSSLVMDGMGIR